MRTLTALFTFLFVSCFVCVACGESETDKRLEAIRKKLKETAHLKYNYFAPSVHINYQMPEQKTQYVAFYNEIRVEETVKHTYFCTIGFDGGYCGIQDTANGHIAIFSVWDKGGGNNNSKAVAEGDRTQILFTNPKAKSSRFGGEGSGAKTMMPYAWELKKTYAFLVLLTPLEQGTIYSAWISEKGKAWEQIAAYKTVMSKKNLGGFYSFIEDYVRNGETGQQRRLAFYPAQGAMTADGVWKRIINGSGTIANDVIQNGHSGVQNNSFFSKSGADTADYNTQPKQFSLTLSDRILQIDPMPENFSSQSALLGEGAKKK